MASSTMKYSRQREAVREFLMTRKDHPTAEMIYQNLRLLYPHISLGTVYRNLSLLVELGEAARLPGIYGFDRFDGDPSPHYHFICSECHAVTDLRMPRMEYIDGEAAKCFDGEIDGHTAYFYGRCRNCCSRDEN